MWSNIYNRYKGKDLYLSLDSTQVNISGWCNAGFYTTKGEALDIHNPHGATIIGEPFSYSWIACER